MNFSECKYVPAKQETNIRTGVVTVTPEKRERGCLERFCRKFPHDANAPGSVGILTQTLLDIHATVKIRENVRFSGGTLPRHATWENGVGVTPQCEYYNEFGCFTRIITGKGTGSSPSFRKHFKQYESMAIGSYCQWPIYDGFGDFPFNVEKFRYVKWS